MNHPITLWPPAGASSTATTIPATDAEAVENARKGLEAARIMESQKPPSPPVTAKAGKLVRVNSVPILEPPKTPVEKIHRRNTPMLDAGENQTNGEEASPKEPDQNNASGTKRKNRLKGKKAKKAKTASEQPVEEEKDANGENTRDDANKEPTGTAVAAPAMEQTNVPQQEAPQEQPDKRPKATASKAAAKRPQQTSPQETLGAAALQQAVKLQAPPMRSEAADDASKKKANEDNLTRANTSEQLPPAQPAADERKPKSGQSGGDLETELDREVKKEDDGSQNAHQLATGTDATSKKRKEKTPAQKAAHARYMQFLRSFDRTLS